MFILARDEKTERRFANITNAARRHCRIGKVTAKPPKNWGVMPPMRPTGWLPRMDVPQSFWTAGYVETDKGADIQFAPLLSVC